MSILKKAKALTKKIEKLIKEPSKIEALAEGVYFYNNRNQTIESLKDERKKECLKCDFIEYDKYPIKDDDKDISGKMCGDCLCSLPYKLRQTKSSCEQKKWK